MPKAFTDQERRRARENVVKAARAEFSRSGYRKANIESIADEAGIAKGTVYLFFRSKAEIFATVLEIVEREMRTQLREELDRAFDEPRQRLEFFFRALLTRMMDHPLLWIVVDPEEAMALFRDLGPDAQRLQNADDEFFDTLVAEWRNAGWLRNVDPHVFGGAAQALFAVSLHRDLLGDAFPGVVDLLVTSLAAELVAVK
ncbi:MAG: TetR/AcrR family transcriptional regulator [Gemmatimonadales bacterium]|nr:TetR/AcrR family transcriptional regulator [Gemmatimonadales bacterium]